MPPGLRPALPEDAPGLGAMHVACWQESYGGLLPEAMLLRQTVDSRVALWTKILGEDGIVWVAEDGGEKIGFGACAPRRHKTLAALGFDAEITALYIPRVHQAAGPGADARHGRLATCPRPPHGEDAVLRGLRGI